MPERTRGPIVIIGAGLTGGSAAKALRKGGYTGELLILGEEPSFPFGRPPLTKGYLRGEEHLSSWMVAAPSWYKAHQVELVPARVSGVDPAAKRVKLESGDTIGYERLLLATGGRNRQLEVPGSYLPGIHQLRTIAECDAIKRAAKPGARAVVVGSGFIGSEVAASLRQLGLRVTSVMRGKAPLDAVLGAEVGGVFGAIHREAGIELIPNDEVVRFQGSLRVERAVTKKGRRIACDLAIVQGGLTTSMELTANRRPFIYFPLKHHFEQTFHVRHRRSQYGAGRCLDYAETGPDALAQAMADEIARPVSYRPVETDGAARAAASLAELV